jgi:tetratricopeptide (TPR) repeat protein
MTDPLDSLPRIERELWQQHAMCDYAAATVSVIDALQSAHAAGRDLSRVIPGIDETSAAVIVAESLEADALLDASGETLFFKPLDEFSDWALAFLSEFLLYSLREWIGPNQPIPDPLQTVQVRAWAALEHTLDSPTASPLLWYEDIYFDVAQEYRLRGDPRALSILKRGLAHSIHFNDGSNAEPFLRDLAETHLFLGEFDEALLLYTALIRNEPDNIWHYNSISWAFVEAGLARLGIQATKRGLSLISATGDPESLNDQFRDSLACLEASREADREQEIDLALLAEFRDCLALPLDAGRRIPYPMLAHELVSDLTSVPVKRPAQMPALPPPSTGQPSSLAERFEAPSSSQPLGRNEPCWCGSGKKYKHCHMRSDREARRSLA